MFKSAYDSRWRLCVLNYQFFDTLATLKKPKIDGNRLILSHTLAIDPFTNRKPGKDEREENEVLFSRIYRKFYVSHGTVHTKILAYEWRALCYSFSLSRAAPAAAASTLVCWKQFDPHFDSLQTSCHLFISKQLHYTWVLVWLYFYICVCVWGVWILLPLHRNSFLFYVNFVCIWHRPKIGGFMMNIFFAARSLFPKDNEQLWKCYLEH